MRKSLSVPILLVLFGAVLLSASGGEKAKDAFDRGVALEKKLDFAKALSAFDRAIALDASSAEAFRHRGFCKSKLGDEKGSFDDYLQATKLDPRNAQAWSGLASVRIRAKDFDGAEVYVNKALDLDPNLDDAYVNIGIIRYWRGDLAGAAAAYDRAIALEPSAAAYFDRGLLRERQKDLQAAVEDFTRAIKADSKYYRAFYNRGKVLMVLGDLRQAEKDLKKALELDPKNASTLAKLEELKGLRQGGGRPAPVETPAAGGRSIPAPSGKPSAAPADPAAAPLPTPATLDLNAPTIPFKPDEPCAAASLNVPGAPWTAAPAVEKAKLPAGVEPAEIPALPAISSISRARYAGAVTAAKEGLRILYGPHSEPEEKKFEALWASLYDFPSQQIIDYLNKLNPLLVRFLAGREALGRAATLYESLMFEMSLAVGYQEKDAFEEILAYARSQRDVIQSLQAGLARLGAEIAALGNPPNPLQAKCEARRRHQKAVDALGGEPAGPATAGVWEGIYQAPFAPAAKEGSKKYFGRIESEYGLAPGTIGGPMSETEYGPQPVLALVMIRPELKSHDAFGLNCLRGVCIDWSNFGPGLLTSSLVPSGQTLSLPIYEPDNPARLRPQSGEGAIPEAWTMATAQKMTKALGGLKRAADGNPNSRLYLDWGTDLALVQKRIDEIVTFNSRRTAFLAAAQKYAQDPSRSTNNIERFSVFRALIEKALASGSGAVVAAAKPAPQESGAQAAQAALKEEIAYHESLVLLLRKSLEREYADLAKETDPERKKALAFRVLQYQSDVQAEQDLIASYQTGRIVHTRSAFDAYAHEKVLADARREAAESDATWRISQRIDRQIDLLPYADRAAKRDQVHRILSPKVVASGDLAKARSVAGALNKQVEGYWAGQAAKSEEAAIDAEESEFYAKTTVMAAGMLLVGASAPAFAQTFGETAAVTLWAPTITGACYGGVTGYIEGGPGEAVKQSLAWSSTLGYVTSEFLDGAYKGYTAPDGTLKKAITGGAGQAGTAYLTGKAFEYGASLIGRGAGALFGRERPSVQRQFDNARFKQDLDDARSLLKVYQEKEFRLAQARANNPGSAATQKLEREARELAASLNSSFHAKWLLKYQGAPGARRAFNGRVDAFYDEMMPQLRAELRNQRYDIEGIEFTPMRNASSCGSVSMDLDLALRETPGMIIRKNGKPVTLEVFMADAQKALDKAYHQVTRTSARRSAVNLTTSAHSESFSDPRLLQNGVDFSRIDPADIAQIGKVIRNKSLNIDADPVLSAVAKVQAKCRESSKEVENMLLPYLEARIRTAKTPGEAAELRQVREHWQGIQERMKGIGSELGDPHRIWELEREIGLLTGGSSIQGTIDELSGVFAKLARK